MIQKFIKITWRYRNWICTGTILKFDFLIVAAGHWLHRDQNIFYSRAVYNHEVQNRPKSSYSYSDLFSPI